MARLIFLFLFLLPVNGWGATYTVCSSGCDETTIQAVFDNNDLGPGDTITVSGGTYNELVTWGFNDEGDATSQVTLQCATGETCTIDGQSTRAQCINFNSRDYITIDGFTVTGATNSNLSSTSSTTGVIIKNIACTGGADCILSQAGSSAEYRGISCTGQTSECLYLDTAASDVTIGDVTSSSGNRVYIVDITNLTIDDDMTISDGTLHNLYLNNTDGTLSITGDITSTGAANYNFYLGSSTALFQADGTITTSTSAASNGVTIEDSTLTEGSYLEGVISTDNANNGFLMDDSSNLTVRSFSISGNTNNGVDIQATGGGTLSGVVFGSTSARSAIHSNDGDGWAIRDGATATIQNTKIYSNGGGGVPVAEGDGITGHDTSTTYAYNNIIHDNDNTCFAYAGTSNLTAYHNTCYSNGVAGGPRGGLWLTSGGTIDLQNNIVSENLPFEIVSSVGGLGSATLDYNVYYHPADGNFADVDNDGTADYATLALFAAGETQDTNSQEANPSMRSDYRLYGNSPAIDAGTDVSITEDYCGTKRPKNKAPDIGAIETISGPFFSPGRCSP